MQKRAIRIVAIIIVIAFLATSVGLVGMSLLTGF